MQKINQSILKALEKAKNSLSNEASELIRSFVLSKLHPLGGFVDRSDKSDPYYSVFGYTLSYVFDIKIDIRVNFNFLDNWQKQHKVDFVHALSLLRSYYLLQAIRYSGCFGRYSLALSKQSLFRNYLGAFVGLKIKSKQEQLLEIFNNHKVDIGGYNHLEKSAKFASVYANFLASGLFEDLHFKRVNFRELSESILPLQLHNGSFVNHPNSIHGITSTTAAGIILLYTNGYSIKQSTDWLKKQIGTHGGFFAGEEVPVADILSTSTALLALFIAGEAGAQLTENTVDFVNLHWDKSGGFFGSVADQIPDVEYTFYALLAIGLLK